jgi:hypothetical protein
VANLDSTHKPADSPSLNRTRIIQAILLILISLTAVYCLSYSGTFITDDEHIFASKAISLVLDQNVNDSRVYGNSRVYALSNLSEIASDQAVNIEPAQQFFGSLLVRLAVVLGVGQVQALFLLNIIVTALTAAAIFGIIQLLGYSIPIGLVISMLYGIGTIAFPYARTYFRDPLAALFLTLAWGCAVYIRKGNFNTRSKPVHLFSWVLLFVFLVAGILSKNTVIIAIPVLIVYLFTGKDEKKGENAIKPSLPVRTKRRNLALIIGSIILAFAIWLFIIPGIPSLARFTPRYYFSLAQFFFTTPHPNLMSALAGPFISPGKSIFLYSPILVLSLVALIRFPKKAWSAWAYLVLLVIGQALFYDGDWAGRINWGLRFTLPAIPLLIISAVPIIDLWMRTIRGRIGLILIGVFSFLVQVVGVLPSLPKYYTDLFSATPPVSEFAGLWTVKYSPLFWNLKWIFSGGKPDLAAIRLGVTAIPILIGFLMLIVLTYVGYKRIKRIWFFIASMFLSASMITFMLFTYKNDPAYFRMRIDFASAQENITREYLQGDLVLIKSYATPAWFYMMNWGSFPVPWTSLPLYFPTPSLIEKARLENTPSVAMDEITLALLGNISGKYQRVWLAVPSDSPGADLNLEMDYLKKKSSSFDSWMYTDAANNTRLLLFYLTPVGKP